MREHDLPGYGPHSLGADRMVRDDYAVFEAMTTAELKRMCTDLSIAAARSASMLAAREGFPPSAGCASGCGDSLMSPVRHSRPVRLRRSRWSLSWRGRPARA